MQKCNEKEALGKNASDNQVKKRETEGYEGGGGERTEDNQPSE